MAIAAATPVREPLSQMNTTPLIDVLLVLLIMIILSIPMATHSLDVDLPVVDGRVRDVDPIRNVLAIEAGGALMWNGERIGDGELAGLLGQVRRTRPEPEVQFRPHALASYARSADVLAIVKRSQVSNFGFVDNEKYRTFARAN